jgi:hypothetical protein
MPGYLLHEGALVQCAHQPGRAEPIQTDTRVKVSKNYIVTQPNPYRISACSMPPPLGGNGPCVTAIWTPATAALRVRASRVPVLLHTSQAVCIPTGTPLSIDSTSTQNRVKGT